MWLSRCSFRVLIESSLTVASTCESSGFGAVVSTASNPVNSPRTLDTIMCRT
jgi:hypothetical protein